MVTARLVNYFDVWGNKKDGWEVNNMCEEGTIELPEDFTDADMLRALKDFGFIRKHIRLNMLNIEDQWPFIEIEHKSAGYKPICRLEIQE